MYVLHIYTHTRSKSTEYLEILDSEREPRSQLITMNNGTVSDRKFITELCILQPSVRLLFKLKKHSCRVSGLRFCTPTLPIP